jgi:hypothetical protein
LMSLPEFKPWFMRPFICPFVPNFLAIVFSVLWFTASDYPFGIFTFFSICLFISNIYIFPLISLRDIVSINGSFDLTEGYCQYQWFLWSHWGILSVSMVPLISLRDIVSINGSFDLTEGYCQYQ